MTRPLPLLALAALSALSLGCREKDDPVDSSPLGDVDLDSDGFSAEEDCDDDDPTINPDAAEICDGEDNNCDGQIDEGLDQDWYTDADFDGYGDPGALVAACEQPEGTVADATDCDDGEASVYPGAGEQCDELDNDCDGQIDEDIESQWYADSDGDGAGDASVLLETCDPPDGYVPDSSDCDDAEPAAYPGATEVCDGIDNNCDGAVDEGVTSTFYADADGDGYGDASVSVQDCEAGSGYSADATDCDDTNAAVNPGADELCATDYDDDCDTYVNEADAIDTDTWYLDSDQDGYGDTSVPFQFCGQPSGFVAADGDCDNGDATIYPGADEYCDGVDTDCDGAVDEGGALDASTWYTDADTDGYGDPNTPVTGCTQPSGTVTDSSDCADGDATAYPESTFVETPLDGIDTDCDGNDFCTDLNCDGLPDIVFAEYYSGSTYLTTSHLYFNQGPGFSDSSKQTLDTKGAYFAAVSDLDQDGYQDIVFAAYREGSSDFQVDSYVYYGGAVGYSTSSRLALPTEGARHLLIKDLNNDGWEDLVFANQRGSSSDFTRNSFVYFNDGSGSFSTAQRTDLPTSSAIRVASEDLDGNGWPDLVFCNFQSNSGDNTINSTIYWGAASGFTASSSTGLPTDGCRDVMIEDLDSDGDFEIVFASYRSSSDYTRNSYIYWGDGTQGYGTGSRESLPTVGSMRVASGDIDGDGDTDLVFSGYYRGSWSGSAPSRLYDWDGGYSASRFTDLSTRGGWDVLVEDLNSDGFDDVVLPTYRNGSDYTRNAQVYFGSASGLGTATTMPTIGGSQVAAGDLDGDGAPELVFNNYYDGGWGSPPPSYVYYGPPATYSGNTLESLTTNGTWARPVLVGNTDW